MKVTEGARLACRDFGARDSRHVVHMSANIPVGEHPAHFGGLRLFRLYEVVQGSSFLLGFYDVLSAIL